jgi:hypothetical protein
MMKFSWAISQIKWLSSEKTNILKTISVLILRVLVLVGFFTTQPFDLADSLRELHHVKLNYCKLIMQLLTDNMESTTSVTELAKSISGLGLIMWFTEARK